MPVIQAFAGIGDFIDRPVKSYSSGMFVRLAFSAAIHVNPDILLVDEALAVGDVLFQHQCIRRIREMQAGGTTIVFVSHDMGMVRSICTEAILLESRTHRGARRSRHDRQHLPREDRQHGSGRHVHRARAATGRRRRRQRGVPRRSPASTSASGCSVTARARPGFDDVELLDRAGAASQLGRVRRGSDPARARAVPRGCVVQHSWLQHSRQDRHRHRRNQHARRERAAAASARAGTRSSSIFVSGCLSPRAPTVSARRWPTTAASRTISTGSTTRSCSPLLPPESGKIVHAKVALPVDIAVHVQ